MSHTPPEADAARFNEWLARKAIENPGQVRIWELQLSAEKYRDVRFPSRPPGVMGGNAAWEAYCQATGLRSMHMGPLDPRQHPPPTEAEAEADRFYEWLGLVYKEFPDTVMTWDQLDRLHIYHDVATHFQSSNI